MSTEKYANAVDLICDKFGLPDFAYQAKVVSDLDKEKVREIIKDIKQKMLEICYRVEPGKNNVIIPFIDTIKKSLPKQKAFDMTTSNRLGGFLSLLPLVNVDKRPRLVVKKKDEPSFLSQVIPFALFQDLQETMCLMEYANGVRPYILEWYNDVFLETYNAKTYEDSKINSRGEVLTENRIAVTTKELIDKTFEVQNKKLSTQQILQTYIKPLVNENIIDFVHSEIDKRARIYFPVSSTSKYSKLFTSGKMNNFSQQPKMPVEDPILYPDKQYIISKIEGVLRYSSDNDLLIEIQNHEGKDTTIEELANHYYINPEDYFEQPNENSNISENKGREIDDEPTIATVQQWRSAEDDPQSEKVEGGMEKYSVKTDLIDEYLQNGKIANKYHENSNNNADNITSEQKDSKELFTSVKMNNLLYSPLLSIEEFFDDSNREPLPEHNLEQSPCRPIIDTDKLETMGKIFYRCKIHPEVLNIDLIGIEHHCRYQEHDIHKDEILKLLSINKGN
jgi:hypothetical protein